MLQRYDPNAIIGAHSDKTVDLENLVFSAFSAYEGFGKGRFDDARIQVAPHDYRVWLKTGTTRSKDEAQPVIRFLTLRRKEDGATLHVPLPPNWMFVMTDQTHRQWTHEIRKQHSARARISVTSRFSATLAQYVSAHADGEKAAAAVDSGDSKGSGNGSSANGKSSAKRSVVLYRASPFTPGREKPLLDRIGELHLASRDESALIDQAYKEQNIFRDRLPNYDKVRLCTRNPGDLVTPNAFLSNSNSNSHAKQKSEQRDSKVSASASASSTSSGSSAESSASPMDCSADNGSKSAGGLEC